MESSEQINEIIANAGGDVLVSRFWMESKLAYPIGNHQKGTYWLAYFEMEGEQLTKIARAFQLCEPVVRELTLKLEPRLVEPILANARGETPVASAAAEPEGDGGGGGAEVAVAEG